MADYHCDIYADVDFGHGFVEIRCTQTGVHEQHRCEIFIGTIPNRDISDDAIQTVHHKNVFEAEG